MWTESKQKYIRLITVFPELFLKKELMKFEWNFIAPAYLPEASAAWRDFFCFCRFWDMTYIRAVKIARPALCLPRIIKRMPQETSHAFLRHPFFFCPFPSPIFPMISWADLPPSPPHLFPGRQADLPAAVRFSSPSPGSRTEAFYCCSSTASRYTHPEFPASGR